MIGKAVAKDITQVGHSNVEGRGDAVQIVGQKVGRKYYVYLAHLWSCGTSILDVTDPEEQHVVAFIPTGDNNTWTTNIQVADNLAIIAQEFVLFGGDPRKPFYGGIKIYDVSKPEEPKELAFFPSKGRGAHRSWYVGGKYAYASIQPEGFTQRILMILDISDAKRPKEVSKWWIQGMWEAGDERPTWKPNQRVSHHGCIVSGDRLYGGWWDAGAVVLDISNIKKPKLVSRLNLSPPYGGATHTTLPLPKRGLMVMTHEAIADNCKEGEKYVFMVDIREETNPVPISILPPPKPPPGSPYSSFCEKGGRFGPHNLHENRPASMVRDDLIYQTYFNAGLRLYDITNPYRPEEVAFFIPPDPERIIDPRPNASKAISSQDVYVDDRGYMFLTDYNAGLYILEYTKG